MLDQVEQCHETMHEMDAHLPALLKVFPDAPRRE